MPRIRNEHIRPIKVWTVLLAAVLASSLLAVLTLTPGASAQPASPGQTPERRGGPSDPPAKLKPPPLTQAAKDAPKERRKDKDAKGHPYTAGELVVTFNPWVSKETADAVTQGVGAKTFQIFPDINARHLSFPGAKNERAQAARERKLERVKQKLEDDPNVEAVDYNYIVEAAAEEKDERFGEQWGLTRIKAPEAWDTTQGEGAKIAVLDSGIDSSHPDLAGQVVDEYDYYNYDFVAEDNTGHGTHVAGTIAAITNNGEGVAGACPHCELYIMKMMDYDPVKDRVWSKPPDSSTGDLGSILNGLQAARDVGVDVINMSFGTYYTTLIDNGEDPEAMRDMINLAWEEGILMVGAAGNHRQGIPLESGGKEPYTGQKVYPAAFEKVMAVSATNKQNTPAYFSNWGDWVDVAAPGESILSTTPTDGLGYDDVCNDIYCPSNGTSMAAPHVSGLAGLLASQGLTASEIRDTIQTTAVDIGADGPDPDFGFGLIDAEAAVFKNSPAKKATDIAGAIATNPLQVTGASFVSIPDGNPNAISDTSLLGYPLQGPGYGILTTGRAADAMDPNASASTALGGGNVRGDTDYDVSILKVDLLVLELASCLSMDFKFLSEEYPEYVGSDYNDAFIAELNDSNWTTAGSAINAPNNFAFDPDGKVVSINSTGVASMFEQEAEGTPYDGATRTLTAKTPITPGAHSLYLSIFDQGDEDLDSAVFVDNLRFTAESGENCRSGVQVSPTTLDASPERLGFGRVAVGSRKARNVTLKNMGSEGSADITVGSVSTEGNSEFSTPFKGKITLEPGQQRTFKVLFDPKRTGLKQGTLLIEHDGKNDALRVPLVGRAVPNRSGCTIMSVPGQKVINGTQGRDVICAGRQNQTIRGLRGNDVIRSGGGNDLLIGGPGRDRLLGQGGHDRLRGGSANDFLHGGPGRDRLFGQGGNDTLIGGPGIDILWGGPGRDSERQ